MTRSRPSWPGIVVLALLGAVLPAVVAVAPAAAEGSDAVDRAAAELACTITGTRGDDVLVGGPGDDVICAGEGDDVLRGGGGDDVLRGGAGEDRLVGGAGDDYLQGGRHDDRLRAGSGDDVLRGGRGNDRLHARDAARFDDDLRCDEGRKDRAYADAGDKVSRTCELPRRNAAPTDLALAPATVVENAPAGTQVGLLTVTDPDTDDTHRFTLATGTGDADNASFSVDGRRLLTAAVLDFERDATLSLRLRVTDRAGATYDEVVAVSVLDVDENASPTAVDDTFSTDEDTALVLPVAGAGSPAANDVDTEPLTVAAVSAATGGTAALAGSTIRFTPDADLCGTAAGRFDYTVSDGRGGTDVGRVTVDVACVPDDPQAVDDSATVDEDDPARAIPVLANDADVDGDDLVIGSVTQAGDGTVVITGGGTGLTYAPDADHCNAPGGAADTFTYSLVPGGATAVVSVTVTCVDDAPVAVDDAVTVVEDSGAGAVDVLANDTDVDGGAKAVASVTQPADGTVVVTGGGTGLTYAPDADYCNAPGGGPADSFTYTLNGGDTATVSVTVTCVDDAPVAVDDAVTVVEDSAAGAVDVLANDTDVDGGAKAVASVTQPADGTVVVTGGGTGLTYAPDADYCNAPGGGVPDAAADSFTYTLGGGSTATVRVTVTCVDDAPVAVDDDVTTDEDVTADIDVLANDTDVDGGARSVASVTQPSDGAVTITGGGSGVRYVPDVDSCGPDTFTYTLDGGSSATVSVTVTCVDDAPVALADAASLLVDSGATAIDVLGNDTDVDGGPTSIGSVTQPGNGTVAVTGGGTGLTYAPDAGYCNTDPGGTPDTFTYTLNGGSTATVSVTVTCDVAPTAVADAATVLEDAAATGIDVLANDTDPDGGPKEVGSVTQPDNGTVAVTGGGTGVSYAPDADYCNSTGGDTPDTFTYTLNGGFTATVSVTVTCVDDDPVAVDDAATVLEDSAAAAVDVLGNDTDVDGGPRAIDSVTQPADGTVVITGGGTGVTYAPDADHCTSGAGGAPDTFTYTLVGGSTATVSMSVTCVNDAPVADDETVVGAIGNTTLVGDDPTDAAPTVAHASRTVTADLLDGDVDVDGPGPLVVTAGTFATNDGGQVVVEADGDFTYTPAAGTSCTDTSDFFDYTVADGAGTPATDTGRVTITLSECVWYVSNSAAGNAGTAAAPFDTLAQAETASAANHTIYVLDGDDTTTGYAAGIDLKTGQRLVGEVAELQVGGVLLRSAQPGARPTITDSNADVVVLASGNTVRGIDVDPQGAGGGIAGGAGDVAGTIRDVRIVDAGTAGTQPGLELDGTSGAWDVVGLVVQNGGTAGASGVRLVDAGTVAFAGANSVTTTGAKALDVAGTALGTSTIGAVRVTGSSTGGVSLVDTTGSLLLGDNSGDDLVLTGLTGATPALLLSNAANVTVPPGGTSTIAISGGPAVDVTSSPGVTLLLDDVDSTGSAGDGVNLAGLGTGTFSAGAGSTISDAAGVAFDLDGGSGSVVYSGTITDDVGRLLRVQNTTGGTKDFNGAITDNGDGDGGELGVLLADNSGATVRLDGGLVVRTTSQPAFTATGGGTVAVLDPTGTNSLQTTTGTPLTVTSTTIHDDDLTFRRVASNGAVNGIVLSGTTNANGRLVVAGSGGSCTVATPTCTGGAVLGSTGAGVSLANVPGGVTLTAMRVANGGDDGIRATTVNDVDLVDSLVTGNGNSHAGGAEERGLDYLDVTGTPQVVRTVVSDSDDSNAHLRNTTGTTTLTVDGSQFSGSKNNAGLRLRGEGSSTVTATIERSVFSLNADPGFSMQTDAANTARQTLTFSDNDVSGGSASAVPGRPQVSINAGSGAIVKASVTNNDIKSAAGHELILNTLPGHTGTFDARVVGNDIGDAQPGTLDPQVDSGSSIWGWAHGNGATRMEIRDNTVANWGGRALELSHNEGTGTADYTVTGNTFSSPDATPNVFEGVYVFAGGATGDTSDVCVDLENNSGLHTAGQQGLPDIAMDRFGSTTVRFADVNVASVAAVEASLLTKNPGSPGLSFDTYGNAPTATVDSGCDATVGTP